MLLWLTPILFFYSLLLIGFTVKPDVLLMGTLQTSATTLVFWLTVWVKQVAQFMWYLVARTRWDFPKCVNCYFNILRTGLRVFTWMSNYQDLLNRVKKAVLFLQGIDDQQIVISYKDLSLQTFINIDRNKSTREYSTNSTTSGVKLFVPSKQALQRNTSRDEGTCICSQYWISFEAILQLLLRFAPVLNQMSTGQYYYFLPFLKRHGTIIMYVSHHKPSKKFNLQTALQMIFENGAKAIATCST